MAVEVHQRGLVREAIELYENVLAVAPDHADALHFLGVAKHHLGESTEALALIEKSLSMLPAQPSALNNLGNINKEIGHVEAAEAAYRKVLELAPDHVDTLSNLAVVLREQKKTDEAHELLKKALTLNPEHSDSYHNLGNLYRSLERYDDALTAYRKSVEFAPDNQQSTLSIAKLLFESGRIAESHEALQRILTRDPDNPVARHLLLAYGGGTAPPRASDDYVRKTFDSFSRSFDAVLERLEYVAPESVANRLRHELGSAGDERRIVDLGCGTGLLAPLVRDLASTLIGVDLSEGMLARARERCLYDELICAELTEFLAGAERPFDVLTSVDTLCYFGALEDFAQAACGALTTGGWLFFSVEKLAEGATESGYVLHPHGRYAHSRSYIESTLSDAGFVIAAIDDVILRLEREEPVEGFVVAARKPD